MEPLIRNQPDELDSLVMENELLRYEVAHLRARLAHSEKALTRASRALEQVETASTDSDPGADDAARDDAARDDTARDDLVWLLQRLDASPAGRLLRSRKGFRSLHDKYLGEADG